MLVTTGMEMVQFNEPTASIVQPKYPSSSGEKYSLYPDTSRSFRSIFKDVLLIGNSYTLSIDNFTTGYIQGEVLGIEIDQKNSSTATISEMIESIRKVLGLNNVQISKALGISRPSLYNHINGEVPVSLDRYEKLYFISTAVKNDESISPNISKYTRSVLVNGRTLLSMLESEEIDEEAFFSAARSISKKIETTIPYVAPSVETQRSITRGYGRAG